MLFYSFHHPMYRLEHLVLLHSKQLLISMYLLPFCCLFYGCFCSFSFVPFFCSILSQFAGFTKWCTWISFSLFFAYLLPVFGLWLPLDLYLISYVYSTLCEVDGPLSLNPFFTPPTPCSRYIASYFTSFYFMSTLTDFCRYT